MSFGCGYFPLCVLQHSLLMQGLSCCQQKVLLLLRRMQRRPDLPFEPLYEDTAPAC